MGVTWFDVGFTNVIWDLQTVTLYGICTNEGLGLREWTKARYLLVHISTHVAGYIINWAYRIYKSHMGSIANPMLDLDL